MGIQLTHQYMCNVFLTEEDAEQKVTQIYRPQNPYHNDTNILKDDIADEITVSVIIPVYNGAAYLRECIDSVLGQKCSFDFEVICVDDGSTDLSPEILNSYATDHRVKVINQKNQGISGARNRGLQEASGQYILFVDNDDVIAPVFLETMVKNAMNTNADIVKCGYQILHNGQLTRRNIEHKTCVLAGRDIDKIYKFNGFCWGTLFRRELMFNFAFPLGYWYEDMVTRLLLYPRCKIFSYIGQAMYYYRVHNSNASGTVWNKGKIKALDQYYLTQCAYEIALNEGVVFTPNVCLAFQYELGLMIYHRTNGLSREIREAIFLASCKLNDNLLVQCPDYCESGTMNEKMLNRAFIARDFEAWNLICKYSSVLY